MRQPVTLKIKFKSANLDQFIERYSVDVSKGGIFIRTKEPLAVGTPLKFEFQLQDSSALISGEGTVVWIREHDPARTGVAPGMGVRFDKLASASGGVLDHIIVEKQKRGEAAVESRFDAGVRDNTSTSGTVTSVNPLPASLEAQRLDSKAMTPLPLPAPGMEGAEEEFGNESTRVMQDDVVARLAEKTRGAAPAQPHEEAFGDEPTRARSPEELDALARNSNDDDNDRTNVDTQALPTPPSVIASVKAPTPMAGVKPIDVPKAVEAAKVEAPKIEAPKVEVPKVVEAPKPAPVTEAPPVATALPVAREATLANERPVARKKSSPLPMVLGTVGVLAAGIIGYYFVLSPNSPPPAKPAEMPAVTATPTPPAPPAPVVPATPPPTEPATPPVPAAAEGPTVAVTSEPPGAKITVDGAAIPALTPTTLKGLDDKKPHEVRIALVGYREWAGKVTAKEGAKIDAKLVANEKVVEISSIPAGADVFVDGKRLGRTPYVLRKVDTSKEHQLEVRHAGFTAATHAIAASDTWESKGDGRDVQIVALTLEAEAAKPKPAPSAHRPAASKKPDALPTAPTDTPTPAADTPEPEKPAAEKPAAEKPAAEKPAAEADEKKEIKVPTWMKKKPAGDADKPAAAPEADTPPAQ